MHAAAAVRASKGLGRAQVRLNPRPNKKDVKVDKKAQREPNWALLLRGEEKES